MMDVGLEGLNLQEFVVVFDNFANWLRHSSVRLMQLQCRLPARYLVAGWQLIITPGRAGFVLTTKVV